jgi:DNA anti-recombination protein RmuC
MVGDFQSQHDIKINKAVESLSELESKADKLLNKIDSEFENRWLNLVSTHNQNLKSFRDNLKEAIVEKVSQQAKKRLDSTLKEFQPVLDRIINGQEALQTEILLLNQKNKNNHVQTENTIKILHKKFTDREKKNRLWILFITLFFSSIVFYLHY